MIAIPKFLSSTLPEIGIAESATLSRQAGMWPLYLTVYLQKIDISDVPRAVKFEMRCGGRGDGNGAGVVCYPLKVGVVTDGRRLWTSWLSRARLLLRGTTDNRAR